MIQNPTVWLAKHFRYMLQQSQSVKNRHIFQFLQFWQFLVVLLVKMMRLAFLTKIWPFPNQKQLNTILACEAVENICAVQS